MLFCLSKWPFEDLNRRNFSRVFFFLNFLLKFIILIYGYFINDGEIKVYISEKCNERYLSLSLSLRHIYTNSFFQFAH